jgi:hypothetical protein
LFVTAYSTPAPTIHPKQLKESDFDTVPTRTAGEPFSPLPATRQENMMSVMTDNEIKIGTPPYRYSGLCAGGPIDGKKMEANVLTVNIPVQGESNHSEGERGFVSLSMTACPKHHLRGDIASTDQDRREARSCDGPAAARSRLPRNRAGNGDQCCNGLSGCRRGDGGDHPRASKGVADVGAGAPRSVVE